MHPAYSVIFFTSASGAGYALLFLLNLLGVIGIVHAERWFGLTGFLVALIVITAGLLASTYHLGRAERAWRAFSQWRSSWLSREGILAVATYGPALVTAFGWVVEEQVWTWAALVTAALALSTVMATAMIYASLRTVRRWRNLWTLPGYVAMALASGSLWLELLVALFGLPLRPLAGICLVALAFAAAVKIGYWRFIDSETGNATAGSATGLGRFGRVKLFAAPHTEENYLLREMGFQVARKHALTLRRMAFALAIVVPVLAIILGMAAAAMALPLLFLAVAANAAGTLTERWLFFAEARHVVTLYYGAEQA